MGDYPVQGRLRIRAAKFEEDAGYIRAHVAELTEPELRSVPGYDFLKFWYADFACTDAQWATLAPELDKRNVLATLFEAPLFAAEVTAKEASGARRKPASAAMVVLNTGAAAIVLVAGVLVLSASIDGVACIAAGAAAVMLVAAGQLEGRVRARGAPMESEGTADDKR